jgi:hypothetical protein
MSPTDMTLNELHQVAHTGLLAGDWLLPYLSSPACWLAVVLVAALPGYSRGTRTWLVRGLATLVLEGFVLFGLMTLPVSAGWLAANGTMASKAARQLSWAHTDPKTFTRITALKLDLAIQDEAIITDGVVDKLVKAGAPRAATENVIMWAMAAGHRQNKLREGI